MSKNDHDIDILLRQNVERQLAGFDWEGLRRGIGSRLANAGAPARSWSRYTQWGAVAASVALVAGVLIMATICTTQPGQDGTSMGNAKVAMVEDGYVMGTALVSFPMAAKSARCEVTILPPAKPREENQARASWCIIAKHEPLREKPDNGDTVSDVMCLF